jgi:uncharacterized protein GlcG (DUF336 family)
MGISLSEARAMVDRAHEHAEVIGVPMNVAVADGGGHLLAFGRMDGAIVGSIDIALAKAKTSVGVNGPSENLGDFCKSGGPAPATEHANGGLIPYAGGVAIHEGDGNLIGTVGVSGRPARPGRRGRPRGGRKGRVMKKILITGAGSGLGRGTATGLARAGHQVIATTQIWPQVTELRRHIAQLGLTDRITVDKLDVLDHHEIAAATTWDFDTFVSNAACRHW